MKRCLQSMLGACLILTSGGANAWSDHASLLWPLASTLPEISEPTISAEPLATFIDAEASGLATLLADHEAWSRATLPHYAPRPDELAFTPSQDASVDAFLAAIRVNPTLEYALYRQVTPGEAAPPAERQLGFTDLSFLTPGLSTATVVYEALTPGDALSAAHIIATASDEPDFGIDIGLFSDNGTDFGAAYGFGEQPFGNPNLDYSSQAPFHMGFYHLDWLTATLQPQLHRTYPEWRVSLFQRLAEFAFERGHPYWGWRFMGWALHYIGDLTQPYHADPLPGIGIGEIIFKLIMGESEAAIQLVSNRHGVIESYQYQRLMQALHGGDLADPILVTLATPGNPADFDDTTIRQQLSAESVAASVGLDEALEQHAPWRFVADPGFEWVGSGEEALIIEQVHQEGGKNAVEGLDLILNQQLGRFSRYAAGWIALATAMAEQTETAER